MRYLFLALLGINVLIGCSKTGVSTVSEYPIGLNSKIELEGKWTNSSKNLKVYIDEELEKIVIATDCEVISANYKRYLAAINFTNIIKTNSLCEAKIANMATILQETVFIQSIPDNQIALINKNKEILLILNKN